MRLEKELVIALCRTRITESERHRVGNLLASEPLQWDSFFELAAFWEVEPVVMSNLRFHFVGRIPETVSTRASVQERESRAIALSRTLILADLVEKLNATGVETLVIKGPAVGQLAYSDVSFRTFSDIDLLVRRKDLPKARDFLLASGYTPDYDVRREEDLIAKQHALEFSKGGVKVELHWSLLSHHLNLNFDTDRIWATAVPVSCAGKTLRSLGPTELFVFLCAHGAKHEWDRLRWICDLAHLEEALSTDQANGAVDLAEQMHALRLLAVGVYLSRSIMGPVQSALPLSRIPRDQTTWALVNLVRERCLIAETQKNVGLSLANRLDPNLSSLLFWARARERLVDRAVSLLRVLFLPTEKDPGPQITRWISRPFRLATKAGRAVFGRNRAVH